MDQNSKSQKYPIQFQKQIGFDKANKKPIVKNETVHTSKELLIRLGTHGIYENPRRVRISHISNSLLTEKDFSQLMLNFKHKLPTTKSKVKEKQVQIQKLLSGKVSQAEVEESQMKCFEEKLKQGRIDLMNVPYEKAKLNSEIDSYETKIRRAMTMSMKSAQPGKSG